MVQRRSRESRLKNARRKLPIETRGRDLFLQSQRSIELTCPNCIGGASTGRGWPRRRKGTRGGALQGPLEHASCPIHARLSLLRLLVAGARSRPSNNRQVRYHLVTVKDTSRQRLRQLLIFSSSVLPYAVHFIRLYEFIL